jgi:RimJ/RimL family protein N-acetyltransferase
MERADIPRMWEFAQDMEIGLVMGADGRPTPLAAMERLYEAKWSGVEADAVRWGIQAHDLLIGGVELVDIDWCHRSAELQVWIGDRAWRRRGCGSDAMRLALGYAFRVLGLHRVSYLAPQPNPAAVACYKAAGFREEGQMRQAVYRDGVYHDVVVLGILRSDWTDEAPPVDGGRLARTVGAQAN